MSGPYHSGIQITLSRPCNDFQLKSAINICCISQNSLFYYRAQENFRIAADNYPPMVYLAEGILLLPNENIPVNMTFHLFTRSAFENYVL